MENASKAVIFAATVLISIIVITIGYFAWQSLASFSTKNAENTRNQQLDEFNTKFQKYDYNSNEENYVTAQDVRTIVNLAIDYNKKYEDDQILVTYIGKGDGRSSNIIAWNDAAWVSFFKETNEAYANPSGKIKFSVKVTINDNSDITNRIEITREN